MWYAISTRSGAALWQHGSRGFQTLSASNNILVGSGGLGRSFLPFATARSADKGIEIGGLRRHYSAISKEEEEAEKQRVSGLSQYQKEMELRDFDAQIAKLNTLRGINTGELYTLRGKFKALARDYGVGFMVWYWCIWTSTCALTYAAIEIGGVDAIELLARADKWTGWDISTKVDPTLGTIGLTVAVNELLEP
eukprot:CAMPEP_0113559776 /NCGR_PEP_ID=MMETSP0015_2-20120614/19077_1 /TAXON_ID=2838 /ORGANISM="Odontella" /LENGTH=193 /DNA_ID=CAMNT_0000461435 /DNA_START=103 /DNA_END=680 /DNA_ORIENTATION=- /assembly_acc=CAM_ASM_000160